MHHLAALTASLLNPLFRLQQEPTEPVNITLHVDSTAFRVSLSKYTVSFNSSNWNKPQLVHIQAGASCLESADVTCYLSCKGIFGVPLACAPLLHCLALLQRTSFPRKKAPQSSGWTSPGLPPGPTGPLSRGRRPFGELGLGVCDILDPGTRPYLRVNVMGYFNSPDDQLTLPC